jgi:hypothetical protein
MCAELLPDQHIASATQPDSGLMRDGLGDDRRGRPH